MADGILLILAHPDDESFMAAGTAGLYRARGVRVGLVCATLGQAGALGDPPVATREGLGAARERELRAACAILGIEIVDLLGYHDRSLAEAPAERVRERLVAAVRRERPRVVITFDPNGLTLHPDHVAISRFASDAVAAAADPRWMPEAGAAHRVGRVVWPAPVFPWDEWRPEALARTAGVDFLLDIGEWRDHKARALRAHRSQHASVERHWFARAESDAILSTEAFRQAHGPPLARRPEQDLFAGID